MHTFKEEIHNEFCNLVVELIYVIDDEEVENIILGEAEFYM